MNCPYLLMLIKALSIQSICDQTTTCCPNTASKMQQKLFLPYLTFKPQTGSFMTKVVIVQIFHACCTLALEPFMMVAKF